jgi:hypothetical protein
MLAGTRQEDTGLHAPAAVRPVDEAAVWTQLTKTWHMRFESERVRLLAMVPGALLDAADEHVNWGGLRHRVAACLLGLVRRARLHPGHLIPAPQLGPARCAGTAPGRRQQG